MCGRFAASASVEDIIETFAIDEVVEEPLPTFNAAPTDAVPAVVERLDKETNQTVRKLVTPRWGLVPSWSKDARGGARMINARAETVAEKPAFRKAFAARRCLIPADGFYEWTPTTGPGGKPAKQPWFISMTEPGPFVMAGLYEFWKSPEGAWLTTCTIITTQATDAVGHLHDRMPMVILPEHWAAWLDPTLTDADGVRPLMHAPQGAEVTTHPVAPLVNNVRHDGPELVQPIG
ncbi:MAG: SOS response-associated peptidase [Propionibacteriaceae bacterium]|nr:SOS response-associated peptidase [Propionibacteriaceae bacterium]